MKLKFELRPVMPGDKEGIFYPRFDKSLPVYTRESFRVAIDIDQFGDSQAAIPILKAIEAKLNEVEVEDKYLR